MYAGQSEAPVLLRLGVKVHPSKGVHPAVEPGLQEGVEHVGIQNLHVSERSCQTVLVALWPPSRACSHPAEE